VGQPVVLANAATVAAPNPYQQQEAEYERLKCLVAKGKDSKGKATCETEFQGAHRDASTDLHTR
jgi:hypothetical protein